MFLRNIKNFFFLYTFNLIPFIIFLAKLIIYLIVIIKYNYESDIEFPQKYLAIFKIFANFYIIILIQLFYYFFSKSIYMLNNYNQI